MAGFGDLKVSKTSPGFQNLPKFPKPKNDPRVSILSKGYSILRLPSLKKSEKDNFAD
jgi:hypothetical protein